MKDVNLTLSTSEANNVGQIVIREDDFDSTKLIAQITENGELKNLSGYTVFFNAIVKNTVIARDIATIESGQSIVSYVLKQPFLQKLGAIDCYFSFEKDSKRESTANFRYHVIKGTCRNIYQGNYIYEFEQLQRVIGDIIGSQDLQPLLKMIEETNSKTESYKIDSDNKISKHEEDASNPHKTTADQVGAYDKKQTLEEIKKYTDKEVKKIIVKKKYIYDGKEEGRFFDDTNIFNYNLSDNQRFVELELLWSRNNEAGDNKVNDFGYYSTRFTSESFKFGSHFIPLILTTGDIAVKQVYVNSDKVYGHERNYTDSACKNWKLRKAIVSYYEV